MKSDFSYLRAAVDSKAHLKTVAVIREMESYRATLEKIFSGTLKRGRDYAGGYDDSIANDLHTCQLTLGYRALVDYDKVANSAMTADDWRAVADELLNMIRISLRDKHTENIAWLLSDDVE